MSPAALADLTIEQLVERLSKPAPRPAAEEAVLAGQGLQRHKAPWATGEDELVRRLHEQGATLVQIARMLHRTARAVQFRYRYLIESHCLCGKKLAQQKRGRRRLFCTETCARRGRQLRQRREVAVHAIEVRQRAA